MMASTLVSIVARFAGTGRIGGLRVGMNAADLGAVLHGLAIDYRNVQGIDTNDKYDSLDLAVSGGRLVLLGLDHDGELGFELPGALGAGVQPAAVPRDLLVAELADAGCLWSDDPSLTFPGRQSALRTGAGVSLVFARPSALDVAVDMAADAELLTSAYLSLARMV